MLITDIFPSARHLRVTILSLDVPSIWVADVLGINDRAVRKACAAGGLDV